MTTGEFADRGSALRKAAKALVLDYMRSKMECAPSGEGVRLSPLFRACGLEWGDYKSATSSNQQYWIVAALRELEAEGFVERLPNSGRWRLTAQARRA